MFNMTKKEMINEIGKFMGIVCFVDYYSRYFEFMQGKNENKIELNGVVIGDDGNMYYRHFGDSDRIHFKKLKNCTKTDLVSILHVCELYIEHLKDENKIMEAKNKENILMHLHYNGEVECSLAEAEELESEGIITIDRYENCVLHGEIKYDAICKAIIGEDDMKLFAEVREGNFYNCDGNLSKVIDWYDKEYLNTLEYNGDGEWTCEVDWKSMIIYFCGYVNKLNKVA